jgi:8-oxo-dGTP pyrophosphatase MutT (NUDIX family)
VGEVVLEIPGGMVDEGEDPMTAAKRELEEETGYTSPIWMFLGKSRPNPAIQNNTVYHYLAANCIKTAEPAFDGHESIATRLAGPEEVHDLIAKGKITHSLVVAAFYFLLAQSKITTS